MIVILFYLTIICSNEYSVSEARGVTYDILERLKELARPFITWLQNAEEEGEDEDEDEDEDQDGEGEAEEGEGEDGVAAEAEDA